jgi:hypothetical protein
MKFLRTLNPFATIRSLRAELADANVTIRTCRDANHFLRTSRDNYREALDNADQAIDGFMEERETFKQALALGNAITSQLDTDVGNLADIALQLTAKLTASENRVAIQAAETLEVVSYVKLVEAELAKAGIEITDTDEGPRVVVNEVEFVGAVSTSLPLGDGTRVLHAA